MPRPDADPDARYFARELRRAMTGHEVSVWKELRNRRLGVKFRRQVPIGPYIADFACLEKRLIIEIDGAAHDWTDEHHRTSYLQARGFTLLRFTNDEAVEHGVSSTILNWLEEHD